jgi:hypothetical protein
MKAPNLAFCGGNWSPLVAAGPQSTLSGVLAGFVFTAITVVLSTSPSRQVSKQRSYALQLFAAAFIIFALDSYFTSIGAGELACNRGYAENVLSGGILGVGAVLMIAGLSWLVAAYADPGNVIAEILAYIAGGIWAVIVIMLAISGMDVGEAMLTNRSRALVNTEPWILGIPLTIAVIMLARHYRDLESEVMTAKWVRFAALSSLVAAIFCGLSTGAASSLDATWWYKPPSIAVYIVIVLSIIVPAVPLLASIPPVMAARVAARKGSEFGSREEDALETIDVPGLNRSELNDDA